MRFRTWLLGITVGVCGVDVACSTNETATPATVSGSDASVDGARSESGALDEGGGPDALSTAERDVLDRGRASVLPVRQLGALADAFLDFDPTINPAKTALENSTSVGTRIRESLGAVGDAGPTCGTVVVNSNAVSVDFGTGCTLKSGAVVSGTVQAALTKSAATTTVAFTFTSVVVDRVGLSGTASFATTTGSTFTINADLTSGTTTYTVTDLTLSGASGVETIDGTIATGAADGKATMTFSNVAWKIGDCYPNGGSLSVKKGLITTTFTFTSVTATTGETSVTVGKIATTTTLPAYGDCGTLDGGT